MQVKSGHDDITDWELKGEKGGMTTPLLQYIARFDRGSEIVGSGGGRYKESWPWCPCLSDSRLYLLRQAASN